MPSPAEAARVLSSSSLLPAPGAALARTRWLASPPPNLERMDRLCALSLCAADDALRALTVVESSAVAGLVFASAHGCHAVDEDYYRRFLEGGATLAAASPRLFVYTLPSSPIGAISIHYGLRGPGLAEVSGAASGLLAASEGLRLLRRAPLVLVVAAEVGSPLQRRFAGPRGTVRDAAAALVLARADQAAPSGVLLGVVQHFCAGAPRQALAQVVARAMTLAPVPIEVACASPLLAELVPPLPCPLVTDEALYPQESGAVGALHALGHLAGRGWGCALVLAADASGDAAAAVWQAGGATECRG